MRTHPDFQELLRLLEEKHVKYVIVGGYAVAFHGYPRFTKDLDIFYEASSENVERLREALMDFGFEDSNLPRDAFVKLGNILSFGVEPLRVDLLNEIDGVSFESAYQTAVRGTYGNVEVTFIGIDSLIKNKRATSRSQDAVDAENLSADR